jgi:signal transduction histidine kinase
LGLERLPPWARTTLVFAVVLAALRPGLLLNFPEIGVAPVWPASGVALAALVLLGRSTWSGVALATLLSGLIDRSTAGAALLQTVVSTGEASLGAWLLERARFDPALPRRRDVFALLVIGGGAPAVPAALVGVLGRWAIAGLPAERLAFAFATWWAGDALGIATVAPFLLVAATTRPFVSRDRRLEAAALGLLLLALGVLVFLPVLGRSHVPSTFLFVPFVLWAAVRLGQPGATAAVLLIAILATAGTAMGQGPLAFGSEVARFGLAQAFLVVITLVGLVVAAAESERRDALRRREEFLSIASHELKTPLTPLRIGLQLMRDHPQRAPELIGRSLRQLDRLSGLVDSLLDVSRLGRGTMALAPTDVDLADVVREVAHRQESTARAAGCSLELHVEEGLVGRWDRGRLEQVIGALLGNAFKYAAGTGVDVTARRREDRAQVVVRDRGAGIPPEDLDRIFREFERGRTDRALGGLGLGLYLARQVVEAHGGTLRAETHAGQGACFVMELPFARPARSRFRLAAGVPWRRLVTHSR